MQNGNVYFNLEIEGLDRKDFAGPDDISDFVIVEASGASLPMVQFVLTSKYDDVTSHLQENNVLTVTIGDSKHNSDTFKIVMVQPDVTPDANTGYSQIMITGFVGEKTFVTDKPSKAYKGTSLQAVKQVIKEYLGKDVTTNIQESSVKEDETKSWLLNNRTPSVFVTDTLLHMNITPSVPLWAFDRKGVFHIYDLDTIIKNGPKHIFTNVKAKSGNETQYFGNFYVSNFKETYNLYSGYNRVSYIDENATGEFRDMVIPDVPILASSSKVEKRYSGNRVSFNRIQSGNVHDNYQQVFEYNASKLVSLSSLIGNVILEGKYRRDIKPLDLVMVRTKDRDYDGLYLVDTICTYIDTNSGLVTMDVCLTRDNKNNIENYLPKKEGIYNKFLKIKDKYMSDILKSVAELKHAYAFALTVMDGTYLQKFLSFGISTKNNILRSFSIAGTNLDFTSQANMLRSLLNVGNSLMNSLLDMIFPEDIASVLRDFVINKPSLYYLISSYLAQYVPSSVRDIIAKIIESLFNTTSTLNSIAKDNGITVTGDTTVTTSTSEIDYVAEAQDKITDIIKDLEDNTSGLDIPFPIVSPDESEALLPDTELKYEIATRTVENLTNLGYLEGIDTDTFMNILLGEQELTTDIIDKVNENSGNVMYYRYWGSYNELIELTSVYIRKMYKDKYKTLPCTKMVSATKNAKIFWACPKKEEDVYFYINTVRYDMESFDVDLGYKDSTGATIMYTVYYTTDGFNSNSILFEVKQGGMV